MKATPARPVMLRSASTRRRFPKAGLPRPRLAHLATAAALGAFVTIGGCSRMRFVVDVGPADDRLGEETVLVDAGATGKIAMLEIDGLLSESGQVRPFGTSRSPVDTLDAALEKAGADPGVDALILRVNSRGGTVTASDMMYRAVQRFREETGTPVVTLFTEFGASGAYYLACATDEIVVYPTTITGSIGVIFQSFNVSQGMNRYGVFAETITSGPNKAMGSMFEPPVEEHRVLMQEVVDSMYVRFRQIVEESRPGISPGDIDRVTDGRILTGEEAAQLGVVDQTGDLHDAFAAAKRLAGLESARLVRYRRGIGDEGGGWFATAPAAREDPPPLVRFEVAGPELPEPGFHYVWLP